MKNIWVWAALLFLSTNAYSIDTIHYFYDSTMSSDKVLSEYHQDRTNHAFKIYTHNVQENSDVTNHINQQLASSVNQNYNTNAPGFNLQAAYKAEFSKLINNERIWRPIYNRFQQGGASLGAMIQLKVEKVPAFVIDGEHTIYGVSSLTDALQIYEEWSSKQ